MLVLSVKKQIEAAEGNAMREQWKEAVDDHRVNQLPHAPSIMQ